MRILIVLLLVLGSVSLWTNSIFSFEGMPIQYYGNDVYGMGMGETGLGDLHRINTNYSNPANIVTANKVIFSTALGMGYMWYLDEYDRGYRDDGLCLPYFSIVVPIGNHKFAFSFNSTLSGNVENQQLRQWEDINYTEINRISSEIYKAGIIYGLKNKYLNFGLSIDYYIGHRIHYWMLDFDGIYLIDTKYEIDKSFNNPGFSLGVNKKIGAFSFGLTYSSKVDLSGDTEFKYGHPPYTDTLSTDVEDLFQIPEQVGFGASLEILERYKTSLDLIYENWKDTDLYDKSTIKVALGISYDPLSGYGKWYEQIPIRAGGYLRELPFEKNNKPIYEKAVTLGTSIPLKTPSKKIDLGFKYLYRGNLNDNGVRDKSIMFYIGITGFDIFAKRLKKIDHRDIPEAEK